MTDVNMDSAGTQKLPNVLVILAILVLVLYIYLCDSSPFSKISFFLLFKTSFGLTYFLSFQCSVLCFFFFFFLKDFWQSRDLFFPLFCTFHGSSQKREPHNLFFIFNFYNRLILPLYFEFAFFHLTIYCKHPSCLGH